MATPKSSRKKETKLRPDAALQRYNVELLKCIDEMRYKRDDVHKDVISLKEEQQKLESDVIQLTAQLTKVNETLCRKLSQRNECESLIADYEAAFQRLVDGSASLATSLKRALDTVAPSIILEESEPSTSRLGLTRSSRQSVLSMSRVETRAETRAETRTDTRKEVRESKRESRAESRPKTEENVT